MSLSIDELYSLYGLTGVNGVTQSGVQNTSSAETEKKTTDGDSYISTVSSVDSTQAIPSENYNDLARAILSASKVGKSADATAYDSLSTSDSTLTSGVSSMASETSQTSAAGGASSAGSAGGAGGAGGSGDSSDSEETETEIVTIDGQTYLQTTTTDSNGNTTVSRTPIGVAPVEDGGKSAPAKVSPAAQALADI